MTRAKSPEADDRYKLLASWEPPVGSGDPVGVIASTFTFDASFFEEELLARFLTLESAIDDNRVWLAEREQKLGRALAAVLVDRRHVSRSSTLAWDLLPVPMPGSACQHAKVAVLAWERHVRVIVGSANITPQAYRKNLEVFTALDFQEGGEIPVEILTDFLEFLRRVALRVPDPADSAKEEQGGPRNRSIALIETISRLARGLDVSPDWRRGATRVAPVFLEPGRGAGVLPQMRDAWGAGTLPDEARILSPFWPEPTASGCEALVDELVAHLAARGDREIQLFATGFEDTAAKQWRILLPQAVVEAASRVRRLNLRLRPVELRQDDESRPLHAKSILWKRGGERELLLIGSSNASLCGLGIGTAPRNFEANLCVIPGSERGIGRQIGACFPESPKVDSILPMDEQTASADEEGGAIPPPLFFRWACFRATDQGGELTIGLGGDDEPEDWSLSWHESPVQYRRRDHRAAGSPGVVIKKLSLDPKRDVPPSRLELEWRSSSGQLCRGHLSINAIDSESRSRPDLWANLDLETLLQILASGGEVHRALARVLRRSERIPSARILAELDPHKRIDTSRLLMQRIRRISQALEGLRERLSADVSSPTALDWRFSGPLSPTTVARKLKESTSDLAEQRFLVAEVSLAVGKAAKTVKAIGVEPELVAERYRAAIEELHSLAAVSNDAAADSLSLYVRRAFERALS